MIANPKASDKHIIDLENHRKPTTCMLISVYRKNSEKNQLYELEDIDLVDILDNE